MMRANGNDENRKVAKEKRRAHMECFKRKKAIAVMVNGLPGKMASKVAEYVSSAANWEYPFWLCRSSLTGAEVSQREITVNDLVFSLFRPYERRDAMLVDFVRSWQSKGQFIAVDFSHPSAVNENAELYCSLGIPFVMGTTGGDRARLEEAIRQSGNCAVVAPNMAKQIVAFQAMMEFASKNFPNVFKGYTLEIVESHQKGKADTSGTAKAMVEYFNAMGIPFSKDQIVMIREPEQQKEMGIPEDALTGHGWHTYTSRSPDGSILFQFTHNVNGRDIYALGTLDAINFLAKNIQPGVVYSMMDVLKGA
jgi:4-hydroxy-tetrahydrodipicolinate reductase